MFRLTDLTDPYSLLLAYSATLDQWCQSTLAVERYVVIQIWRDILSHTAPNTHQFVEEKRAMEVHHLV